MTFILNIVIKINCFYNYRFVLSYIILDTIFQNKIIQLTKLT